MQQGTLYFEHAMFAKSRALFAAKTKELGKKEKSQSGVRILGNIMKEVLATIAAKKALESCWC